MASADTLYTARFQLPELLERGRANLIKCPIYRSGALVAPSSATVSVYDAAGTALVSAAAATITGSVAQYSVPSAVLASSSYGEGWRVEWLATMPDGTVRTYDVEALLVRRALFPVVSEVDLYRVSSALDPAGAACIHSEASFANKLDEAWIQIQGRLLSQGRRPNLVLSPQALRDPHLYLSLALIYEDFSTRLNAAYAATAAGYRAEYESTLARTRFLYDDEDDNGRSGSRARRGPAVSSMWLASRGGASWRW